MLDKKIRCLFLLIVIVGLVSLNANNPEAKAREKSIRIGNFQYTYSDYQSDKIWITDIKILSTKGIKTLKIPSSIDGKKVVKLGKKYEYDEDNIFGMWICEDNLELMPKRIIDKVKKIEEIILPSTLKELTRYAFNGLQDGKSINIPYGITSDITILSRTKWSEFKISSKNKMYQVIDGVLCSKDGLVAYGSVLEREKIYIPEGVKRIENHSRFADKKTTDVYIPSSLESITPMSLDFQQPVGFHVAAANSKYAVADNCIYNKKKGSLVAASAKGRIVRVPEQITELNGNISIAGDNISTFVIPESVEWLDIWWFRKQQNITYIFESEKPPLIANTYAYIYITFCVPIGCREVYHKATEELKKYCSGISISESYGPSISLFLRNVVQ